MGRNTNDEQKAHIVDIKGLAQVLLCSESMILKTWRQYPHFFIGNGCTAKGARFDVNDVIDYLKKRDYANVGQTNKKFQRSDTTFGLSSKNKNRIQDKECRPKMGVIPKRTVKGCPEDEFGILTGLQ